MTGTGYASEVMDAGGRGRLSDEDREQHEALARELQEAEDLASELLIRRNWAMAETRSRNPDRYTSVVSEMADIYLINRTTASDQITSVNTLRNLGHTVDDAIREDRQERQRKRDKELRKRGLAGQPGQLRAAIRSEEGHRSQARRGEGDQ